MNSIAVKSELLLDWATHAAARYACENWHYSKSVPVGKTVKIGAWEGGRFIGVVLFAWGMNKSLGSPYGLAVGECCELVRIALTAHNSQTSRIMTIAVKMLKRQSPGLRLVVSFSDPAENHHGGIYQAANWIYSGQSAPNYEWRQGGRRLNKRAYTGSNFGSPRMKVPDNAERVSLAGKHRYLMPLDGEMSKRIKLLAQPYPKRAKDQAAENHSALGGETPTRALQNRP